MKKHRWMILIAIIAAIIVCALAFKKPAINTDSGIESTTTEVSDKHEIQMPGTVDGSDNSGIPAVDQSVGQSVGQSEDRSDSIAEDLSETTDAATTADKLNEDVSQTPKSVEIIDVSGTLSDSDDSDNQETIVTEEFEIEIDKTEGIGGF